MTQQPDIEPASASTPADAGGPSVDFEIPGGRLKLEMVEILGSGGQGTVFRAKQPGWVVKQLHAGDSSAVAAWQDRLEALLARGIEDLPIAMPEAVTAADGSVFYAAQMLDDMRPLGAILAPHPRTADATTWLRATGGMARRMRLLARLAWVIAALHRRGLVYGDLSPNNVFVSSEIDHDEVWLIDADNIDTVGAAGAFTSRYGAPELERGEARCSFATDVWALATMAFEMLALTHPMLGDGILDGEPELETSAYRGELPWVDDLDDDTNRTARGLPRDVVLTSELRALAQATFGEGRDVPLLRPSAAEWASALEKAAGWHLVCENQACGQSYLANHGACVFCDAPMRSDWARIDLLLHRFDPSVPEGSNDALRVSEVSGLGTWVLSGENTVSIPRSKLFDESRWFRTQASLKIRRRMDGRFGVEMAGDDPTDEWKVWVAATPHDAKQFRVTGERTVDRDWYVLLEKPTVDDGAQVSRVLRLQGNN